MLRLPRDELKRFRALWRRCHETARPQTLPRFRISSRSGRLAFLAQHPHGLLGYVTSQTAETCEHTLPGELLDLAEQTSTAEFVLKRQESKWHCRWNGDGERSFAAPITPDWDWPGPVKHWGAASGTLLPALRSACQVASVQPGRWATHRLQMQGEAGRLLATDTRQVLLQEGLRFPFADTILIPALPIFSAKEWRQAPVKLARVEKELHLQVENWLLTLRIDPVGRFPDCVSIVPRSPKPTQVQLSDAEARLILQHLADGDEKELRVTLDLRLSGCELRCGVGESLKPPLGLPSAQVKGPEMQATLEAKYLQWGLQFGLRTVQLISPEKPVMMSDSHRQLIVATLHPSEFIPCSSESDSSRSLAPLEVRMTPARLPASVPKPEPVCDPLEEAETIRGLLQEASTRLGQLIQQLKTKRKTERALNQVVRSIQALPLPERP